MKIFSIKNEKLGFFNRPIYAESCEEALSYVMNVLMSDADRALLALKDDLNLYCLGWIDFTTGKIDFDEHFPYCVSTLKEIFDMIPEDKIPRSEREIRKEIEKLAADLREVERIAQSADNAFNNHVNSVAHLTEICEDLSSDISWMRSHGKFKS